MRAAEYVEQIGFVKIKTPWYTDVANVLHSIDRRYVVCEVEANCGTKVHLKFGVDKRKPSNVNPDTFIVEMKTLPTSKFLNMPDSNFYCLRCKNIYDRSFARQKGPDGGNKCKNCYNLGRIEERSSNIQAKNRLKLHSGLKGMLSVALKGEVKTVNKSALVRYVKNKYGQTPAETARIVKSIYGVEVGQAILYASFHRPAPIPFFREILVGCTRRGLILHIESQFEYGWTWENMGEEWELDHIKPYNAFDLTDEKQIRECMHYTNLRPLSIKDNRAKRSKHGH